MLREPAFTTELPEENPDAVQNNAVINPYALAELIVGRKINWKEVPSKRQLLEDILQTPYEELFDPIYEGPLYTGLRLNEDMKLEPVRSPLLDVEVKLDVNDLEQPVDVLNIQTLADLGPYFDVKNVGTIAVHHAEMVDNRYLCVTLRLPDREHWQRLARVFTKD
ncbi:MAG: hypothetical protein K8L99_07390, partial [Anaerolineae bacterium]|nr:hypothetical protein [Anaerolineae bacterium]